MFARPGGTSPTLPGASPRGNVDSPNIALVGAAADPLGRPCRGRGCRGPAGPPLPWSGLPRTRWADLAVVGAAANQRTDLAVVRARVPLSVDVAGPNGSVAGN